MLAQVLQNPIDTNKHERRVALQIDGIHCAGCVWLLEKLPSVMVGVTSSRVNVGTGQLDLCFQPEQIKLSQIAAQLDSLGYPAHLMRNRGEGAEERMVERALLVRLGVAGFCAANSMMLAVSLYEGEVSGMEGFYANFFRWITLILALPAVLFSAMPFYQGAWQGLRFGAPQIDLPISVAIILGFLLSAWNTFHNETFAYYDSLTVLIFLLLAGRYLQLRATKRARFESSTAWELLPHYATRQISGKEERVLTEELSANDRIVVCAGERVPVDGVIAEGSSAFDRSIITGESLPITLSEGRAIEAGVLNIESPIVVSVVSTGEGTRLGRVLRAMQATAYEKPRIVGLMDVVSRYFVIVVLLLAVVTFFAWYSAGTELAIRHAISLLIVTCPCALGLAVPVTVAVSLARAGKAGILVKDPNALERLHRARCVFWTRREHLARENLRLCNHSRCWMARRSWRN